jgi:methyl-accepting chemotaxis protein
MDITLIFGIVLACLIPMFYFLMRIVFKNTIVFKLGMILLLIFETMPWLTFFLGAKGIKHIWWALPVAWFFIFLSFYLIKKNIQIPLKKIIEYP